MPEPKIKAGMPFMDMKSAVKAMQDHADKIGGTVCKDGDAIVLKNKQGKKIACVFTYTTGGGQYTPKTTTYRYNDWEGREYCGKNVNGNNPEQKFTEIFSGDGMYVAHDKDGDGKVSENEIDLNM